MDSFWIDCVFAPATHQSCDLLGAEVLSQVILNCHLNLRDKLPSFAAFKKALIGHLISLFVRKTSSSEVSPNLPTDRTPTVTQQIINSDDMEVQKMI
jgi:hypothetical protein